MQLKKVTHDPTLEITYNCSSDIDEEISHNYHRLLTILDAPEYRDVVQEIRQFVDGFDQMVTKILKDNLKNNTETPLDGPMAQISIQDLPHVTLTIRKFLDYINDKSSQQYQWNSTGSETSTAIEISSWESMKESMMESFLYSKCFKSIDQLLPRDRIQQDLALEEKIQCLYTFLKPEHLDIHYFTTNPDLVEESTVKPWDIQLSEPIHLIHVLDRLCAPSLILSYILKTYKSISTILDGIMARGSKFMIHILETTESQSSSPGLPGADDIFPTLIWTLICAQPKHLVSILSIVDSFSCHDEIRGELAYAYTSFYSAAQFLRDLNLEAWTLSIGRQEDGTTSGLSISREEMQKGLDAFKISRQKNIDNVVQSSLLTTTERVELSTVSVHAVREARVRGEVINLDWALQHLSCSDASESTSQEPSCDPVEKSSSITDGFNRIYPYLHADANDIRMSDVPLLLKEYQSLVRVVEHLYSERNHSVHVNRKEEIQLKREEMKKEAIEANELLSQLLK